MLQKVRRIDQILPSYSQYDAIGNEATIIRDLLRTSGFESDIFAEDSWDSKGSYPIEYYSEFAHPEHIALHHFSIGSNVPFFLKSKPSFVVTRYHNITPAAYFDFPELAQPYLRCMQGRAQIPLVKDITHCYWPVSEYNEKDFGEGRRFALPILPVLRRYDYLSSCVTNAPLTKKLAQSDRRSMLFVGRVVPNKAQHDLIVLLSLYHRFVSRDLRLFLVGGMDPYYGKVVLPSLAYERGLTVSVEPKTAKDFAADVIISGSVGDDQLVSYYQFSDVYVSLSNHEGFGVPLIEAMFFGIPLLCHPAAAIPETVGNGAVLVDKDDPVQLLQTLHALLTDETVRTKCLAALRQRRQRFQWDHLKEEFELGLDAMLRGYSRFRQTGPGIN